MSSMMIVDNDENGIQASWEQWMAKVTSVNTMLA